MSTDQSLDPQLIEQTKQQIRSLVNEIAQLARSDMSPAEFYGEFLTRVVSALAAIGGAIWTTNEEGRLSLQYQINFGESRLQEEGKDEDQARHARLLYRVLRQGEGTLMPPHSGSGEQEEAGNPTDFLLVLGPLKTELETLGVVEILQRPDTGVSTQKGYLRFLMQMCELACDFLKGHQLRHFSDRQVLWTQLEDFTHTIHSSLDPRTTAYTIANEARRLIDCDRVSVALRKGRKCTIQAISGQDLFDKRSNIVRLLGKLATEVVAAGDPIWYTGDTTDFPPQIEVAVQEYVDEAHSKAIAILPLKRPLLEPEKEGREKLDSYQEQPFGALIVEQIEDAKVVDTTIQRVNVVCRHSATALGNAVEFSDLFLMPVWRALGKTKVVLHGRTLPKVVAGAVAIVAAILAMIFVPADFELQAKGTIEPLRRRDVYARIDGVVDQLMPGIDHGTAVTEGQVLGKLRNTEVEVGLTEVVGQLQSTSEEIRSIQRTLVEEKHRMTAEEQGRQSGKLLELRKTVESLQAKHQLLLQKQKDLLITSPISGTVITWDLVNRLIHRPVQRGQVLLRVGDLNDAWQLEVYMPEDHMGPVAKIYQEYSREGKEVPVTYILASEPGTRRKGLVREVHASAEIHGDEGSAVLIKAVLDEKETRELPPVRPGTTVTAKVYCGRRSIGYVWLHDAVAFIQSRVLFRWF